MTNYSKLNIIYKLQKWMDSVPGQTFLNYAYSWGASIVILGTLFKLTHLPGANFFLYLGMGTEVVVFFLSAFDRPFDKTTDGMELDIHPGIGGESATVVNGESGVRPAIVGGGGPAVGGGGPAVVGGGGTVIINGGGGSAGGGSAVSPSGANLESVGSGLGVRPERTEVLPMAEDLKDATSNYIDELNRLTEMLTKVSEQSQRLTADSEEMENLNRTLTGISRVYEMQLKSASSQMGTIDEINEQTRHMAQQIAELNAIYARMIEAMSVQTNNKQ
ncbi:MAG: gliding motility protein GldL [Prevotella sp.]|nr:gliding motility protein GldL [Prevotella sp.]